MQEFSVGDLTVRAGARQTGHVWTGFYSIAPKDCDDPEFIGRTFDVKGAFPTEQSALDAAVHTARMLAEDRARIAGLTVAK